MGSVEGGGLVYVLEGNKGFVVNWIREYLCGVLVWRFVMYLLCWG